MNQNAQDKVLKAGFTVIRTDDLPNIRIKKLKRAGVWETLENFPTKTARDRKFKELLKDDLTIED